MDRVVGLLPGGQMTLRVAAGVRSNLQVVIVVDVACRTSDIGVTVCQGEAGYRVIEGGGIPTHRGVTVRAIGGSERRSCRGVHGIVGLLPGR